MSTEAQDLLANFDALPLADQQFVEEEIARRAEIKEMREAMGSEPRVPSYKLAAQEWSKRFHAWAEKQKLRNSRVDDSRESIYDGCGE